MQLPVGDYQLLKAFLAWMVEHVRPVSPGLPPEHHPVAVMEDFERHSMAIARKGLAIAVGDLVEELSELTAEQVDAIDAALRADGIMTFTEVRARFWSKVRRILRKGLIRNEDEYYALRNVIDSLPEDERGEAWGLLAAYEERKAAR